MRRHSSTALAALLLAAAPLRAAECPSAVGEAAAALARLRPVPAGFAPPCRQIAPAALEAELDRKLRRDLPIAPELFLETLHRLGLVDEAPGDVYPRLLRFYASQVLGFYEPDGDELEVVDHGDAAGAVATLVWAHELAHAAQEHRFHLPTRLLAERANGDAQRAASAIAEGEAMLVSLLLAAPAGGGDGSLGAAAAAVRGQVEALRDQAPVPAYFIDDLAFPYTTGFTAVLAAYREGGWAAVDRLLAAPARTTAALLYPTLPPPGPPLDDQALPAVPAGWDVVITDTVGAWGLATWLSPRLEPEEAGALAAHWDGDRIRVVRSRSDPTLWAFAWRVRARGVAGREQLQRALQLHLRPLLSHLSGGGPVSLTWIASGRELEVRAAWPSAPPS
jgi:hypothetical protein